MCMTTRGEIPRDPVDPSQPDCVFWFLAIVFSPIVLPIFAVLYMTDWIGTIIQRSRGVARKAR
jgi:hypothetical protein